MERANVRNQEVTDAQGRRRFHGAFTGGFSAGYYNSVGTAEGWTPQTFASSRGNRSAPIQQRAEDFMDEEDDPLLGKRLETTERYDTLQTGAKQRLQRQQNSDRKEDAAIPGFSLPDDWVLAVNDSVGAKLLKQMGWKEGHGIGQRVRRRKFQEHEEEGKEKPKLLMPSASGEKAKLEEEEEVYVPPRKMFDVQKAFPKPKLDRYGAGFDPYTNAPEFASYMLRQEEIKKAKEGSHRQVVSFSDALKASNGSNRATSGYGLSALEEDDDVDVYGTVSMTEFDRIIAPLGAKNDIKRLDSSAQESRRHEKTRRSRALCSDGRPVLPGFDLATTKEKPPKVVNLRLAVPSDFKSFHRFDEEEGLDDAVTALYRKHNFSTGTSSGGVLVTAKQRGVLLGDQVDTQVSAEVDIEAKGPLTSVFDLLGEEQKAKLFNAAAQAKQGLPLSTAMNTAAVEKIVAPEVRQPLVRGSGGDQFRATISASIAKRFVSSKSAIDVEKSEHIPRQEVQAKLSRRSQCLWVPKSLLCKRFHVKCAGPTENGGKDDDKDRKRDLFDKELVPHLVEFAAGRAALQKPVEKAHDVINSRMVAENAQAEDKELPPLPAVKKTSTSLLKSIFEPSDESELSEYDSEDEDDDDDKQESTTHEKQEAFPMEKQFSIRASSSSKQPAQERRYRQHDESNESSSSEDEVSALSSNVSVAPDTGQDDRGIKRLRDDDDADNRNARLEGKDEKRRHKKHKKHHKHRDKEKKAKKDKKDRKSHKHRSSRHSRRSRSRSADRTSRRVEQSSDRRRSDSRRH